MHLFGENIPTETDLPVQPIEAPSPASISGFPRSHVNAAPAAAVFPRPPLCRSERFSAGGCRGNASIPVPHAACQGWTTGLQGLTWDRHAPPGEARCHLSGHHNPPCDIQGRRVLQDQLHLVLDHTWAFVLMPEVMKQPFQVRSPSRPPASPHPSGPFSKADLCLEGTGRSAVAVLLPWVDGFPDVLKRLCV